MSKFKEYFESVIVNLEKWVSDPLLDYKHPTYKAGDYLLLATGVVGSLKIVDFIEIMRCVSLGQRINPTIIFGLVQLTGVDTASGVLIKEGVIQKGMVPEFNLEFSKENHPTWVNPVTDNIYIDIQYMLYLILKSSDLLQTCHIDLFEVPKLLGTDIDVCNFYERLIAIRKILLDSSSPKGTI